MFTSMFLVRAMGWINIISDFCILNSKSDIQVKMSSRLFNNRSVKIFPESSLLICSD